MNDEERTQAERVLQRISQQEWNAVLSHDAGQELRRSIDATRAALAAAGHQLGKPPRPIKETIAFLGERLLSDQEVSPRLRRAVLRSLPPSKWTNLKEFFKKLDAQRAETLHGNATQQNAGSEIMAEYWHRGSRWARAFCEQCGFPAVLAGARTDVQLADEDLEAVHPLPPLHDYQQDLYKKLKRLLTLGSGAAGLLSLPTGAGKTRVAVDAIVDSLALEDCGGRRNVVLWIAQSDELLRQTWRCFRQVWVTPPLRADKQIIPRSGILRLCRAWGGRTSDDLHLEPDRTIVLAGIQQLGSWLRHDVDLQEVFPPSRIACIVVDEAHRVLAPQHRDVLHALGVKKKYRWEPLASSPPLVGLTATPWRSTGEQTGAMRRLFCRRLLTPKALKDRPVQVLRQRGFLSKVEHQELTIKGMPPMTASQLRRFKQLHEVPADYLSILGTNPLRNAAIVKQLNSLPKRSVVLVFACSVQHARILAMALGQVGRPAAVVSAATPRNERLEVLDAFNQKKIKFLCNVGVLTTGFDAPQVDVVCITRPTASALLYEQMVGRGLRGPMNGGTEKCIVLDVQDEGLPQSLMSYARVMEQWRTA